VSDTATEMIVVVMSRIKATFVVQRYVTSFNMVSCQIKPTRRHQIGGASDTEVQIRSLSNVILTFKVCLDLQFQIL
jgi:hypothetical protein